MCKGCCDKAARVQESDHGACQFDILKEITVAFPISALPHDLKNLSWEITIFGMKNAHPEISLGQVSIKSR